MLPPRIIAQNNLDQMQMPIPFNNLAAAKTTRDDIAAVRDCSQDGADSLLEIGESVEENNFATSDKDK